MPVDANYPVKRTSGYLFNTGASPIEVSTGVKTRLTVF